MARTDTAFAYQALRAKRPRRTPWIFGAVMFVLLAPFAIDGTKICFANWVAMQHGRIDVDTPAFDAAAAFKREASRQLWELGAPILRDPPWQAGSTIALAGVWAVALAWVFRTKSMR